jgi:hypothetical protein
MNTVVTLESATGWRTDYYKQKIEAFGPGTQLRIELENGKKLRGTINSLDDAGFDLTNGKRVVFDGIKEIRVTRVTYPDGASRIMRVHTSVRALGGHRDIKLRLVSGKTITARICATREDAFDVLTGRNAETVTIPYDDVEELSPVFNAAPSKTGFSWKKWAIGYGLFMLLIAAAGGKDLP